MTGGLMVAESADQLAFLEYKAGRERKLGLAVDILGRDDLDRIAPYLGPQVIGAELCHDEGKLNPLLANAALRRRATELGVRFHDRMAAVAVAVEPGGYRVVTQSGPRFARRLVLAAAAGTAVLAAQLGLRIPAEAEPLHMNITEPTAPLIAHLVQHADRPITLKQFGTGQVVIGGGWPARLAGRRDHPTVMFDSMIGNATLAQHIVPRIGPLRIIRTWAGLNTTVDGRGVLGAVDGLPGLFAAIPGDAGYTLGPLSARLVADAVLGLPPREDMAPFAPARFAA
jgi:glycine/D-amino acid oxidase-like deaminating enzyme